MNYNDLVKIYDCPTKGYINIEIQSNNPKKSIRHLESIFIIVDRVDLLAFDLLWGIPRKDWTSEKLNIYYNIRIDQ